ncbi:MAG: LamG-like jellyroll fold domain-containing protein [Gemmatimonadota bacterium]
MLTTRFHSHVLLTAVVLSCGGAEATGNNPGPNVPTPPPAVGDVLLHSTLDGPAAVMGPTLGSGVNASIVTSPANDFVPAKVGNGLRVDAIGERILIPQADNRAQNVELERGTIEFWYRPGYNHNDNHKYTIVGTGNWPPVQGAPTGRGSIHLGKHNDSNNNDIFLIFFDANGVRWEHNVPVANYGWRAGDWLLVRLTWDFGVPAGVQNLHLYVNGNELRLAGHVSRGPQPIPAERSDELMYIGSRDVAGSIIGNGIYDEVRVWNRVLPP